MKILRQSIFFCLLTLILGSCVQQKELVSLNRGEVEPLSAELNTTKAVMNYDLNKSYKIRPQDQLMIYIKGLSESTEVYVNLGNSIEAGSVNERNYDPSAIYYQSYTVQEDGTITLPILDQMVVVGLTAHQLKERLDREYDPYMRSAFSTVKVGNLNFSVIGEVNNPGLYEMYHERITLLDAIGQAGDFTDFGNRAKVKLVRRTTKGSKTAYIDFSKSDFIYSEFYFVHPDDVIYVEPLKAKSFAVTSQSISVVLSSISLGVALISLIFK